MVASLNGDKDVLSTMLSRLAEFRYKLVFVAATLTSDLYSFEKLRLQDKLAKYFSFKPLFSNVFFCLPIVAKPFGLGLNHLR